MTKWILFQECKTNLTFKINFIYHIGKPKLRKLYDHLNSYVDSLTESNIHSWPKKKKALSEN